MLLAASRMISCPVVVSPVKAILPTPGCAGQRGAGRAAGAGDDVDDARREPASSASSPSRMAVSGV